MRPAGRLVLLTGASAGIGAAAAREFVAAGDRVLGVARRAGRLDELSAQLGGPPRFLALVADVADGPSMEALAARVLAEHGVPDVIVANAGVGLDALFAETGDEALREVFETNVFGVVRTVRPFLPGMIERGSGRILFVSSVVAKRGLPHYAAYSGSKFALHGMADALASELAGTGVSVGLVCPSSTGTEFHGRAMRSGPQQRHNRPRRHSPESVARAIVRMSRSRRRQIVLSLEGKLMAVAARLAPASMDRLLAHFLKHRP